MDANPIGFDDPQVRLQLLLGNHLKSFLNQVTNHGVDRKTELNVTDSCGSLLLIQVVAAKKVHIPDPESYGSLEELDARKHDDSRLDLLATSVSSEHSALFRQAARRRSCSICP